MVNYPQTLVTRFYGLHKIKYKNDKGTIQRIYFIIMQNVFNTTKSLHVRYDLKGSKYGRRTRKKTTEIVDPTIALKDQDADQDNLKIEVDQKMKDALIKQINIDTNLFK